MKNPGLITRLTFVPKDGGCQQTDGGAGVEGGAGGEDRDCLSGGDGGGGGGTASSTFSTGLGGGSGAPGFNSPGLWTQVASYHGRLLAVKCVAGMLKFNIFTIS